MNKFRVNIIKIIPFLSKAGRTLLPFISILWLIFYFQKHIHQIPHIFHQFVFHPGIWIISILSMTGNWYFRVFKWQTALKPVYRISFKTAFCQQLKTFALSLWTPVNSGEFIGKPMFFQHNKRFVANAVAWEQFSQMSSTTLWGIFGVIFIFHQNAIVWFLPAIPVFVFYNNYARLGKFASLLLLSSLRYLFFGGAFAWLLHLFSSVDISHLISAITVYYFGISIFPLLSSSGLAARLITGIWIFERLGISSELTASIIFWLWIWNSLIPAVAGLILHFKKPACGNH